MKRESKKAQKLLKKRRELDKVHLVEVLHGGETKNIIKAKKRNSKRLKKIEG